MQHVHQTVYKMLTLNAFNEFHVSRLYLMYPFHIEIHYSLKTSKYEKLTRIVFEMQFKKKNLQWLRINIVVRYHFFNGV